MTEITGRWKLVDSENFEEFMKTLGVGMVMRKLGASSKPIVEITNTGDDWSIKTETALKNTEIKFKLGEEFEEDRLDGARVKTVVTLDDGKLVQKQFGDKEVSIIREVDGESLKVTCTVGAVLCTRRYERC